MSEEPETVFPATEALASYLLARKARQGWPAAEVNALGQAAVVRLLSAGLDLNVALTLRGEGAAESRLRDAICQIDEAVGDVRRLMLAVSGALADASPNGGA